MSTLIESLSYQPVELNFGTSGLRGLVTDITDLETYINTRGFINFLKSEQKLATGSVIYFAGDLRQSTPRIMTAVYQAIIDTGFNGIFGGLVPTPAISYCALVNNAACVMVTGSHIPEDRNGIKFCKLGGEVLKDDEQPIKQAVAKVREEIYNTPTQASAFDNTGSLKQPTSLPTEDTNATTVYLNRYKNVFESDKLTGKTIVYYQHSGVGRDMIPHLLENLGANVKCIERTDHFIAIDTENVTPDNQAFFKKIASENPDCFAIISTDGDSDRPFVIDENGIFHRGDELGAVVAKWLDADFAVVPISSSDAVDIYLNDNNITYQHTKIGSPYVIKAMSESNSKRVVGWEANGGFLTGSDMPINNSILKALPTRDAVLPILVTLVAASERDISLSTLFNELPQRFTQAGLIDNFPPETSRHIVELFSNGNNGSKQLISRFFSPKKGFGAVSSINTLDGIRIFFDNGDIAHIRPSSNAPQLRLYSVANSQARADEIVENAITEPNGILRQIEQYLNR